MIKSINRQQHYRMVIRAEKEAEVVTKVTGIGGFFFKVGDLEAFQGWYREHLGIPFDEGGGWSFLWRDRETSEQVGRTVWGPFSSETRYFDPSEREFMFNFRVDDLEAVLSELKEAGVQVMEKVETYEYGRFGWALDPQGNKIEFWEPAGEQDAKLRLARRWFEEMWSKPDLDLADELVDLSYDPEWVGIEAKGPEQIKREIRYFRSVFPDLQYVVEDYAVQDDRVWVRYKGTGTHLGTAWGFEPTGKWVSFEGAAILYVNAAGRVIDRWGAFSIYDILVDLGVVPPYWELSGVIGTPGEEHQGEEAPE
jgi:predicted enzyme related to lactoylglutathione lyase